MQFAVDFKIPKTPLFDGSAPAVIADETRSFMNGAVLAFQGGIVPLVPVNTGTLRQGVQTEVTGTAVDLTGRVFNPLPYAVPVETGTVPHFPPIDPIQLWVERKLGKSGAEARSVAFLIARKISVQGTKATRFFETGIAVATPVVAALWVLTGARITKRLDGGS